MDKSEKIETNASTFNADIGMATKEIPAEHSGNAAEVFLRTHEAEWGNFDAKEARHVLWKIDRRLLPLMMITTILAAVDVSWPTPWLQHPY